MNSIDYIISADTRENIRKYLLHNDSLTASASKLSPSIPKRLYKYCALKPTANKNELPYILQNLVNNTLTLSRPALFNDCYDCSIHTDRFEYDKSKWENDKKIAEQLGYEMPYRLEQLKDVCEEEKNTNMSFMRDMSYVGCLSEVYNSLLMWAHYSDSNQGICIEYDLTNEKISSFIYPAIYVKNPIDVTNLLLDDTAGNIEMACILSAIIKADIWSYEKEWRILSFLAALKGLNQDYMPFINKPNPTCIYLGRYFLRYWEKNYKENEFIYDTFYNYLKDKNIPVKIMKYKIGTFELVDEPIDLEAIKKPCESLLFKP